MTEVPVLVTTLHRGVFFGFAPSKEATKSKASIRLFRVRNCIRWSGVIGGFLGLAKSGPNSDCKIGSEAPEVLLHDITSVTYCTDEAVASWTA